MSNSIFPIPTYPAGSRGWPIHKYPVFNTLVETPLSRRGETRISTTPYATWNFELTFPLVPGTFNDGTTYLNQLVGFYLQMQGQANSFLLDGPQDNTIPAASPATFGLGDGTTKAFQLTRPIGGYADIIQNVNGTPVLYMNGTNITPHNLIFDSDGTSGTWTGDPLLVFSSTGGAVTGGKWTYTGTGAASTFRNKKSQVINVVPGTVMTLSGYIDASHISAPGGGQGLPFVGVWDVTRVTNYAGAFQSVGTNGRVSATFTVPGGVTSVVATIETDNVTVANGQPLVFSDLQLEAGSTATAYQSTNVTGYSIDSLGVVTFNTAPANSTVLAWSGKYYFRCRFSDDSLSELTQIFTNIWQVASIKFQSIIL